MDARRALIVRHCAEHLEHPALDVKAGMMSSAGVDGFSSGFVSASPAATWTARHGVGSHALAVRPVKECSTPAT